MKYFGTDGIRRKAEEFTPEFLARVVRGLIDYAGDEIRVMLAGDTRESSEWMLQDLAMALESFGVEYALAGVLPTPAINYCFYKMGFDFAIDVTASHNPYTDNGIKIFERGEKCGRKLCEQGCEAIEKAIAAEQTYALVSTTLEDDIHEEAVELYIAHLLEYLGTTDLSGLSIAMDCANGATSVVGKTVFEELGAKVELINADARYGTRINRECGSTHLGAVSELVMKQGLDFGVAYDGDGDRCLLVDGAGEEVDGDQMIALLARQLGLPKIAVTVMANQGLLNWAKEAGVLVEVTAVGDSNVAAAMRSNDIALGGEQSGHIILPGEPTGDGILTSLMVAKTVSETAESLTTLAKVFVKLPQVMVNIEADTKQKEALKTSDEVKALLLEYSRKLGELEGRLLVRPSGTEPLIRITMWGNDKKAIGKLAEELADKLERTI
ncbi:phosphoglucosamine mutase [Candidatus Saccharibacteria bacterium]|nr:phosphoglucosamine mutase [Candidatus Saccharibacteria bacterium]